MNDQGNDLELQTVKNQGIASYSDRYTLIDNSKEPAIRK